MGIFSGLFDADKVADNVLDKDAGLLVKMGHWINTQSLTDQELLELNLQTQALGIKKLEAMHPFKVLQRIMVTIIVTQWAILFNLILIAICFQATAILTDLKAFAMSEYAWYPMVSAVTLYLLGGVWKGRERNDRM